MNATYSANVKVFFPFSYDKQIRLKHDLKGEGANLNNDICDRYSPPPASLRILFSLGSPPPSLMLGFGVQSAPCRGQKWSCGITYERFQFKETVQQFNFGLFEIFFSTQSICRHQGSISLFGTDLVLGLLTKVIDVSWSKFCGRHTLGPIK